MKERKSDSLEAILSILSSLSGCMGEAGWPRQSFTVAVFVASIWLIWHVFLWGECQKWWLSVRNLCQYIWINRVNAIKANYSRTRLFRFHLDLCILTVILKDCYNEVKFFWKGFMGPKNFDCYNECPLYPMTLYRGPTVLTNTDSSKTWWWFHLPFRVSLLLCVCLGMFSL